MNHKTCITLLLLLPLTACSIDNNYYHTPHPDRGAVTVRTGYTYKHSLMIGATTDAVQGEENTFSELLAEGRYTLTAFNVPDGMTAVGSVLTVNTLPDGTLTPCPGTLMSNATEVQVVKDDTTCVSLPLQQRTRELTLKLTVKSATDAALIDHAEAILTGIAPAIDVTSNKLTGMPAAVKPLFTLTGGVLTAELNLTGTFPDERQMLTITLTTTDGQQQTLTQDLTEVLAAFNRSTEPLTLTAGLDFMTGLVPRFNIGEWTEGEGGSGDAV